MISKEPIMPRRIRKVPRQFSWLDHRLIRDHHIERCSHAAAALYLFLVTVGDAKGMSYYGDAAIMRRLNMDEATLAQARNNLIANSLIAWQRPLYQVLALDPIQPPATAPPGTERMTALKDILLQAFERKS
jgi:hypothetical protein